MSGFTPLSERLGREGIIGVESLSRHLNDYFGPIVDLIHYHGGDVIKFAGDAIMVLFAADRFQHRKQKRTNNNFDDKRGSFASINGDDAADAAATDTAPAAATFDLPAYLHSNSSLPLLPPRDSLAYLILQAAVCASDIHSQFNEFTLTEGIVLKLHSALSAGPLWSCCVGGAYDRYEYLLQGTPISDLKDALNEAEVGELIITQYAYAAVKQWIKAEEIRIESDEASKNTTTTQPTASDTIVPSGPSSPMVPQPALPPPSTTVPRVKGLYSRAQSDVTHSAAVSNLTVVLEQHSPVPSTMNSLPGSAIKTHSLTASRMKKSSIAPVSVWRFVQIGGSNGQLKATMTITDTATTTKHDVASASAVASPRRMSANASGKGHTLGARSSSMIMPTVINEQLTPTTPRSRSETPGGDMPGSAAAAAAAIPLPLLI